MKNLCTRIITTFLVFVIAIQPAWPMVPQISVPSIPSRPSALLLGQSVTLLPDGRWLLLGGQGKNGPVSDATIVDPATNSTNPLKTGMISPRAWHSATLLPNGKVLVIGGIGPDRKIVTSIEIYDPYSQTSIASVSGLLPRAHHTATLLTDGRVLVAGGIGNNGSALPTVETWDTQSQSKATLANELGSGRRDHFASILPNGNVLLWGGTDGQGEQISYGDLYDCSNQSFTLATIEIPTSSDMNVPTLEASLPPDGGTNVPANQLIGLRFSKVLQVQSINTATVQLSGPDGLVASRVVPAEGGTLAFVTPNSPLLAGATYTITLQGPTDSNNLYLVYKQIVFTVSGPFVSSGVSSGVASPMRPSNNAPPANLPPLQAPQGVTAVSGQTLQLNGAPLGNVTVTIGNHRTMSDRTGRFLVQHIDKGHQVIVIEGKTANNQTTTYGLFEVGIDVTGGITNVLDYKVWMTPLDTIHAITIPSPTLTETVITNPQIPGLRLLIPPHTVIYDFYGHVATKISITPVPTNQPPFPLPKGFAVPTYFTIQPGGAYLQVGGNHYPRGARLIYPNVTKSSPGTTLPFWNYDPDQRGWYVYGKGRVTDDQKDVAPDPGVEIYEFTMFMVQPPAGAPGGGPPAGGGGGGGDPVDTSTGYFLLNHEDISLPDVIPLALKRTYRQGDTAIRAFGMGTSNNFDTFLVGDKFPYTYIDLVLPDGGRIHYARTSPGTGYTNAAYVHTATPTIFFASTVTWNGNGWTLTFKDGTIWTFPDSSCCTLPEQGALLSMQDHFGNQLTVSRQSSGQITQITSPNGRWLQFTYGTNNCGSNSCISQVTDNIGRIVKYQYDGQGRLITVTDPNQGLTTYGYNGNTPDQMTSITDARNIQFLQNMYDSNGRVHLQTLANQGTYQFVYSTDQVGNVTQTAVTDPNGNVQQLNFATPEIFESGYQTGGYITSETFALGKPEQQTFTYNLGSPANNPGNFVLGVTDPLNRVTSSTFDATGNLTSTTHLAGSAAAATTSYTYEPTFNRVTSVTDPLGETSSFTYNDPTSQIVMTDPMGNKWTTSLNSLGQTVSLQDPLGQTWHYSYKGADVGSEADPLNNTISYVFDGAGRMVSQTDPLMETTFYLYDNLDNRTSLTDPLGEKTTYTFDANSNLTTITDPLNVLNPVQIFYDDMDHVKTRTDPLGNSSTYQYDLNGNLTCFVDRKGQVTRYSYDGVNRKSLIGFGPPNCASTSYQSSVSYGYDGGNRITNIADSIGGTISRQYDGLDNLKYESTPQGSVNYLYDSTRRRQTMTVTGQTTVSYKYNASGHVTSISQGSSSVGFTYDNLGRQTTVMLPNGVAVQYSYDADSHVTGITYSNGPTSLGNLTYSYDANARRTQIGGTAAQINLPAAVLGTTYNVANELINWGSTTFGYDANANLQTDGLNTYNWDERNQLSSITGSRTASFQYDGLRRRIGETIGSTTTNFLYDQTNIIQELSGATPTANLLIGLSPDEIFTRTDVSGTRSFLRDAQGSTIALVNNSGSPTTGYVYDPFGNTTITGAANANSYQYTGRENDGTSFYFYRARYYQPGIGRFVSEDPLGCKGGPNVFAYAFDDPANFTDPSGLKPPPPCKVFCVRVATLLPIFVCGDGGFGQVNKCSCPAGVGSFKLGGSCFGHIICWPPCSSFTCTDPRSCS